MLGVCAAAVRGGRSAGATPAAYDGARAESKAAPKLSDAQLEAAIRAKFSKSKSATGFTVRVQGGIATIDGRTDVIQHKGAATRMAKTAGAVAVNNRVQVSEAAKKRGGGQSGRRPPPGAGQARRSPG